VHPDWTREQEIAPGAGSREPGNRLAHIIGFPWGERRERSLLVNQNRNPKLRVALNPDNRQWSSRDPGNQLAT
jgi:hypothetical protein